MKKSTKVKTEEQSVDNYQQKFTRALADYQNLLKQNAKEKAEYIKMANREIINDILPVYEYLKISLDHCEEASSIIDGLKYTLNLFQKVLSDYGVTEIEVKDRVFDHEIMEAVETKITANPELENRVAELRQNGYMIHERVLKPARVVVYKTNNN